MSMIGQEEQIREYHYRYRYLYLGLFIGIGILFLRLLYLQVIKGEEMRLYSEQNRIKRVTIPAPRGMIFDRNGKLLIDNRPAFDLEITPQYLRESKKQNEVLSRLSQIMQMPLESIEATLKKYRTQPPFMPVKIKQDLTREEVAKVMSWQIDLPGVEVKTEIRRTNLFGEVGAHLLGYVSKINSTELPQLNQQSSQRYKLNDVVGKFGIEQKFEDTLRGVDGEKLVEVDALGRERQKNDQDQGRVLSSKSIVNEVPGKNIFLTIDQDLQLAAYEAFGDKIGAAVAIDPSNGEVLAMISKPSFDTTEFSRGISDELYRSLLQNPNKPFRDKTIQDHYTPGSTFKIFTGVAALEEGLINENTSFYCKGSLRVGNRVYHCHKKEGHGEVNIVSAIEQSCNVFFYRVAQLFPSIDVVSSYAKKFGLGERTGVPLAREVPGLIPTEAWKKKRFGQEWTGGETLLVAIGQSFVLTTAIQLANAYAALTNGGTHFQPRVIRRIEDAQGSLLEDKKPIIQHELKLKPKTRELVLKGLYQVIQGSRGTARAQRIPGIEFSGKSGTSQVIRISNDKIYQKCINLPFEYRHHGLFVGFAPPEDPKIVVAVVAEHACSGSGGAAPVVKEVIKKYLEKNMSDRYETKVFAKKKAPETSTTAVEDDDFVPDMEAPPQSPVPQEEVNE